jgi:DNA-directed RNA polymerase specialized sigma24 family protein
MYYELQDYLIKRLLKSFPKNHANFVTGVGNRRMTKQELVNKLVDSRLHTKAREFLEMVYVEGKSQADAARVIGVSPQSASQYVNRFRKL